MERVEIPTRFGYIVTELPLWLNRSLFSFHIKSGGSQTMADRANSVIRNPGSYLSALPFSVLASSLKDTAWPNMAATTLVTWPTFHLTETSGNPVGLSHIAHLAKL